MRRFLFPPLVLIVALVLSGCGDTEDPESPTRLTDDLGRTVEVNRPVERVVSLAPNLTELAFAAGAGHTLVAVTSSDDYPPAVDSIDHVSALPVDFEALARREPDLVLATDQVNEPGDTDTFASLDLPVYFFSFSSLTDVFESIERMGTLLGTEQVAQDSARALRRRAETLRSQTADLSSEERPRVLVLIGDETLYSFGQDSYIHTLVDMAGGRSVTDSLDADAPTLTEEYVLTEKPDVIVGAWGTDYDPDRLEELHPTWDVVPALQNDRVYSLPEDLLLRPGPRLVDGAWRMAARLHPDRVSPEADSGARPDSASSDSATAPPTP
ncbi:MAG: ABC transporter substrate-binding protein [Salinivenus sp.]